MNRRTFLSKTAAATVGLAAAARRAGAHAQKSPNETVNVAIIGLRGHNTGHPTWTARGRGLDHYEHLSGIKNVRITHVVDIDERHFGTSLPFAKDKWGGDPKTETDFRRVLDNRDVDAVTIAAPDHWHALMTIWACQAGKDVYVEKPISHNIVEGRRMIEAARRIQPRRAGGHAGAQRRGARQGRPVPARWRTRHDLHGQDGDQSASGSDRRRGGQPGAARRALRPVAGAGARRVRSTRTTSTITGTGSGNTAPAISATRPCIRSTRRAGCSASRSIRERRTASVGMHEAGAPTDQQTPNTQYRRRISMRTARSCTATCGTGSAVRRRRKACSSSAPRAG